MNAKALVVPLLAVLAIAGFFVLRSGHDADPAPVPAGQGPADGSSKAAVAAAEVANAGFAPTPAAAVANEVGRTAAPVGAAGATSEMASVRGRLVDAQGAPRPGVVLTMSTWSGLDEIELVDLPPMPRRDRDRDSKEPTWTTRADGTFQVTIARDRSGSLGLQADDLVFAKGEPVVQGKKGDQDLGDVTVLRAGLVQGIVQDERGQPVGGVKVAVVLGALGLGSTSAATTKADGVFSLGKLRPGKWSLRTASGKFLPAVVDIDLGPEEQRTDLVLVVKPGRAIAGQVVDDRGVGVAGMKVGSKRKEVRGAIDIERFSSDEATTTDAHGYFTLSGLADEVASVRAFGPGHSPATAVDVPVGTGNLVLRVERLGIVEGVLVATDGSPIAGSRVIAQAADAVADGLVMAEDLGFEPPGREGVVTGADGAFRLDSVRPGSVTVVARGKTHRPARKGGVDVLPAQVTKGIRLVADLGGTARVKVVDEAGKPVAGATVRASRGQPMMMGGNGRFHARAIAIEDRDGDVVVGGGDALGSATTDEQGMASLGGLPAGEVSLAATHKDFAPAPAVRTAVPKMGAVDASLTLRKPGSVEILVLGTDGAPQPGVELLLQPEGDEAGEPQRIRSDDAGTARAPSLAPGNYSAALARTRGGTRIGESVMVLGDGNDAIASSAQKFTIAAGETTRLELRRPVLTRVSGVVTSSGHPAAGCVVELAADGDPAAGLPGFGGRTATAGGDGAFAFDDVEPGHYVLQFGKPDQVVKARQDLEVPASTPELRQDLVLRTGKLRVQVVAKGSGEAVEKAEVEVVRADRDAGAATEAGAPPRVERRVMMVSMVNTNGGPEGGETTTMTVGAQRAHTDESGVAEIDDVPVGDYTVRIKHRKHAPYELKAQAVAEGRTTDCGRIELAGAGIIRGKVVAADGKPAGMALVSSRPFDSQQWSEPVISQAGNFRLQGLAAGKYKVRAQAIGPTPGAYSPEIEVDVKAGEVATADLQLPPQ